MTRILPGTETSMRTRSARPCRAGGGPWEQNPRQHALLRGRAPSGGTNAGEPLVLPLQVSSPGTLGL
jgi:hypothetical protein